MKKQEKMLRAYYRNIKRELICPRDTKSRILSDLQHNVNAYLSENPDAALCDVQDHFGTPQQIAASYVEALGTPELLGKLKLRRRILTLVAAVLAVGLIVWAIAVVIASIDAHNAVEGYAEVFITEDEK